MSCPHDRIALGSDLEGWPVGAPMLVVCRDCGFQGLSPVIRYDESMANSRQAYVLDEDEGYTASFLPTTTEPLQ